MKKQTNIILLTLLVLVSLSCSLTGNTRQNRSDATPTAAEEQLQAQVSTNTEPAATGTTSSGMSAKIGSTLNLVIGTKDRDSVYPSYHLESTVVTPTLSDDKASVIVKTRKVAADVQGKNVHLFYTAPDADQAKEGYIIGDKEYRITNGKPEEMIGQIALSWAGWHLEATFPFSAGASLSTKTGTETLDGRQADVYSVDSTKIDPAVMESFRTIGMFPLNTIHGKIWVDQQTGGTLKALIDYEMDMINPDDGKTVGVGQGHLELEITQIGNVSVQLP